VLLYHASILFEAARYADMLEFFSAREAQTMDPQGVALLRARAYLATGASEKAEMTYETLLKRNGEDRSVVEGWLSAKGVKAGECSRSRTDAARLLDMSQLC
jgi:thioredoxin-like negative regulator of GroEL